MSTHSDYTVGWISALPTEAVAATVFQDQALQGPATQDSQDSNVYRFGKIGDHNVVIATLPKGEYGTAAAASVAKDLTRSFRNVRIGLMVGIAGGAPSSRHDIRLGDVVVSTPVGGLNGVFQYDFGKSVQFKEFQNTRSLDQPPQLLRAAVASLEVDHTIDGNGIHAAITAILDKKPNLRDKFGRPQDSADVLFKSIAAHGTEESCQSCINNGDNLEKREPRGNVESMIHYGTIASANTLMKDAIARDKLAAEKDVLCFDREAAGLMNGFRCLVIRGICDYSDTHKYKIWQGYAAMAAAAYAKQIIRAIRPEAIEVVPRLGKIETQVSKIEQRTQEIRSQQEEEEAIRTLNWLSPPDLELQQTDNLRKWQRGTVQWLLESP
ncbi:putative vps9-ankyrin repeat-containing protein [Fusarium austroafricanum]|uniref:Putative vps9-ankyrin repeat-containing protein n=1 Tax=Fusarium austroafricanum TaxID=2364996 RepID=A0A8H4JXR5_9HYPO|nr:putative vps9-ankyrin repeat-containing protein [Fusarium austroafricanum]